MAKSRLFQGTTASEAKIKSKRKTISKSTTTKPKRLTNPKSPKLRTKAGKPLDPTNPNNFSPTTRELLQIQKEKEQLQQQREKTKRYRQATQGVPKSKQKSSKTTPFQPFTMTLRSGGVVGIPVIQRKPLTEIQEFDFQTEKRAKTKRLR